jgi:acetyl esterase
MHSKLVWFLAGALLGSAPAQQQQHQAPPDHANVAYGPHERNVMDVWLAKPDRPTPVVVYIHGGGFARGDKSSIGGFTVEDYRRHGWSVAAVNYRFTDTAPAPAAYLDCGRAIQFLRSKAGEWNLDKQRFASTGGSAGAGTSMWLAFHDDLADPKSADPVARESTRLTCVAVDGGQCSYDPRFVEAFGIRRPNLELHSFFLPFYGITEQEIDSKKAYRLYEEMAAITHLTKDDPPCLLNYNFPNRDADPKTELGLVVHHPRFGIVLKKRMDALGIECIVQYPTEERGRPVRHGGGEALSRSDFIAKQFGKARQH